MKAGMAIVFAQMGLMVFMLASCGEVTPQPPAEKPAPYVNAFGQGVIKIKIADLDQWLADNKKSEIVSITAVSDTMFDNNATTHYLIVYRKYE